MSGGAGFTTVGVTPGGSVSGGAVGGTGGEVAAVEAGGEVDAGVCVVVTGAVQTPFTTLFLSPQGTEVLGGVVTGGVVELGGTVVPVEGGVVPGGFVSGGLVSGVLDSVGGTGGGGSNRSLPHMNFVTGRSSFLPLPGS